ATRIGTSSGVKIIHELKARMGNQSTFTI
ncbi:MAG: deoxyribose-phosphate aldolase, partial [Lacticaseibacillus paracasei]